MREVTQKVYEFRELAPEIREKVLSREKNRIAENRIECDADDYRSCLKAVEQYFGINVFDWEVNYGWHNYRFRIDDNRWEELSSDPKYLSRYLRDVIPSVIKGKYYHRGSKDRRSKIIVSPEWTITGMWVDDAIMRIIEQQYEYMRKGFTIEEFCDEMLDAFFAAWQRDIEYCYEDDFIEEELENEEREYLENGREFYEC